MARAKGKKRTAAQAAAADESSKAAAAAKKKEPATRGRPKRVKAPPKPKAETEYFPEKRNLEDLWLSAFPVGTEWENIDKIKEFNWNFEHLEKALEEGGELYGKTVYVFGSTEPQLLDVNGESKIVLIPIVVVVDCPFPPSDKIGINSVQRENEEIVPMKAMKMAWVPYVPLEERDSRIDSLKTKIFILGCTQRRSALKHLKTERVKKFDYCMPCKPNGVYFFHRLVLCLTGNICCCPCFRILFPIIIREAPMLYLSLACFGPRLCKVHNPNMCIMFCGATTTYQLNGLRVTSMDFTIGSPLTSILQRCKWQVSFHITSWLLPEKFDSKFLHVICAFWRLSGLSLVLFVL